MNTIDEIIKDMNITNLRNRDRFRKEMIDPEVETWVNTEHQRLSQSVSMSAQTSMSSVEGEESDQSWSTEELVTVGAAAAFSIAPMAAIPLVGSVITAATIFSAASIAVIPIAAVILGSVAFGAGPIVRGWALEKLKKNFREKMHNYLTLKVLGDIEKPKIESLLGTLLAEIDGRLKKRLEEVEEN